MSHARRTSARRGRTFSGRYSTPRSSSSGIEMTSGRGRHWRRNSQHKGGVDSAFAYAAGSEGLGPLVRRLAPIRHLPHTLRASTGGEIHDPLDLAEIVRQEADSPTFRATDVQESPGSFARHASPDERVPDL